MKGKIGVLIKCDLTKSYFGDSLRNGHKDPTPNNKVSKPGKLLCSNKVSDSDLWDIRISASLENA